MRVPFGSSERIGFIDTVSNHSDYDTKKIKPAYEILDSVPLFSETDQKLIRWASQYYQTPLGEVLDAASPSWLRKGHKLIDLDTLPSVKNMNSADPHTQEQPLSLNTEQAHAIEQIVSIEKKFQTFLLEGITGSGKTEVYLQVIEHYLNQGSQILILVPEIGLTPQMIARIEARFSVPVAILHSSVSEKKRFMAWQMARTGVAPIVIGTRSAAFTPLKTPGIFIIDEEHDASFKQQDSFRYSARDLLIKRASLENCPIVLGTATPSLETLHNAEMGRSKKIKLTARAGLAKAPSIQILDVRHKKLDEGLSAQLIKHMTDHLAKNGQVLLFLNRRGFAPVLMCFDCGFIATCSQCDARLTVHHKIGKLRCHHCELSLPLYKQCPHCTARNLSPLGIGTERLEAVLKVHFPDKEIIRIDRDTMRRKKSLQTALDKIQSQEAQILLGTQMIAKGHHFPNVTLVGILEVDQALFSSDFRSTERLGQLLTQVAGRAGRAERLGQVVLQTCHPENPLLNLLITKGYSHFAERLLMERQQIGLPPFSHQALIRAEAKNMDLALNFLTHIKNQLRSTSAASKDCVSNSHLHHASTLKILGPIAAPMERKIGKYRAQLLLQTPNRLQLQRFISGLTTDLSFAKKPPFQTVRWSLDVDPIDMF